KDDLIVYDQVFDRYWRRRTALGDAEGELSPDASAPGAGEPPPEPPVAGDERIARSEDQQGTPVPGDEDESVEAEDPDASAMAPDAYSRLEALRPRDFD